MIGLALVVAAKILAQYPPRRASDAIPQAPPLPRVGSPCVQISPHEGDKGMPTIVPALSVSTEKVAFHGIVQNALLQGSAKSPTVRSGYLYVRLDADRPIYLGFYPGGDPLGTQIFVGFPGMNEGPHSLDFGFVEPDSTPFSYGRFCFIIRRGVERNYELP